MNSKSAATKASFELSCPHCGMMYDLAETTRCSCLVPRPSWLCPACVKCFCEIPPDLLGDLWSRIPPSFIEPETEATGAAQEAVEPADAETYAHPLVLVVDDDPHVLEITRRVAESMGYGVAVAGDGKAALEMVSRLEPDLVLTDLNMPDMDGAQLTGSLKAIPAARPVPVVIMTAAKKSGFLQTRAKQIGAAALIYKPIKLTELQQLLDRFLSSLD